jgi:L-cysteine:1D-myo-inositol 2-amino-2-deoxy-alpha-D-glucopyranoside ligase
MGIIIKSIQALVDTGNTYMVDSDLYFDVHSDSNFGSRSHLSQDEMLEIFSQRGGDPKRAGKRNPLDALLWRGERPGEPSWESPFGAGRPGWHIECSAIALSYLSDVSENESADKQSIDIQSIDIQGGGSDLVFPHHEMSASQCVLITNKEFASHYVHAGMIGLDGEKMSKSLGNLVFVSTLISQGVEPAAIRWALFSSHFTQDRMWSHQALEDASRWIVRLRSALSRVDVAPTTPIIDGIIQALAENLDTSMALKLIQSWIVETENGGTGGEAGELSRALDTILGLAL